MQTPSELSASDPDGHVDLLEPDHEAELTSLLTRLDQGALTEAEQVRLGQVLPESGMQLRMMVRSQSFSGPIPPPNLWGAYDSDTRKIMMQMALDDQRHMHEMQKTGLNGAIAKDRRGQIFGLTIGVTGLLVAGFVATFSPAAAAVIAAIDLVGLVALFVVPRMFEKFGHRQPAQDESSE